MGLDNSFKLLSDADSPSDFLDATNPNYRLNSFLSLFLVRKRLQRFGTEIFQGETLVYAASMIVQELVGDRWLCHNKWLQLEATLTPFLYLMTCLPHTDEPGNTKRVFLCKSRTFTKQIFTFWTTQ